MMKYEIVEMQPFSGDKAKIYSIIPEGESLTLFEVFIERHQDACRKELGGLLATIYHIGHTTGARYSFFKHHEGRFGDFVCALYDRPDKRLRVYCIRFGMVAVIIGGGGEKPGKLRAWQNDPFLAGQAQRIIEYASDILNRMDKGDIYWSEDKAELQGNLKNF